MTEDITTDAPSATTESEEMYLITIAMATENGHRGPVPVPQLAASLGVSRVSANEMVKKLAARHLIHYAPYKGATLSVRGERIADAILRRRRLWSVFLTDQLGLTAAAADTVACEMEHITPADVAQRLATFLGDPKFGPQGKRIPPVGGEVARRRQGIPLRGAKAGSRAQVDEIEGDEADRTFLSNHGIKPGSHLTLLARAEDGACLVSTDQGRLHLSEQIADTLTVIDPSPSL